MCTRRWRRTSPSSAGGCGRALTLADKVVARPSRRPRAPGDGARPQLSLPAPGSRRPPGRAGADGHAAVHADAARPASRCRPPSTATTSSRRASRASATCASRSRRTRRSTTSCKSAAAKYGVGFWGPGAGIIHQVVLENYAFPGRADHRHGLAHAERGRARRVRGRRRRRRRGRGDGRVCRGRCSIPRHIAVVSHRAQLSGWTAPKDVILYVAGKLTVSGGTNAIVEYIGPGARTISATGKATITNMGAELGATTSMFPYDEKMARVPARHRAAATWCRSPSGTSTCSTPDPEVEAHPGEVLRPRDRARPVDARAARRRARTRPTARGRSRKLAAEVRRRRQRLRRRDRQRADRQLHQLLLRGHEPRRRRGRAGEGARPHGGRAVHGHAGLRAGARHDRARRPDAVAARHRRHRAGQRLRAVHRPVAPRQGGRRQRANTIVTSYNRNFPRAQRRRADDDELHREPRDRHRARAGRPALVQSAHRHA